MKKCKVVLKKIMPNEQISEVNRNTDSVETVVWRIKTPNSPMDLSMASDIEMSANSVVTASTTATVIASNPSTTTAPNMVIASSSGSSERCNGNASTIPIVSTSSTLAQGSSSTQTAGSSIASTAAPIGSFITVNALGIVMPTPSESVMISHRRNRDACTILSRVISAELLRRANVHWPHHVWTMRGDSSKAFVVRAPNPIRVQSGFLAGINNIDLNRVNAILKVLEVEYDFTLDLF